MSNTRTVEKIITGTLTKEGEGFTVRRPFPTQNLSEYSPFLLIDELGPILWKPNEAIGAPAHPHRGFETVSYILKGHISHRDSLGNSGTLSDGDVQWMTAGSGVVHEEIPHPDFKTSGGWMHAFQIWLNLPAKYKNMPPRYQSLTNEDIPLVILEHDQGQVKVIAGTFMTTHAKLDTIIPIYFFHIVLNPSKSLCFPIPEKDNAILYVFEGSATIGEFTCEEGQMVTLEKGQNISFSNDSTKRLSALFLSGQPTNEPIARYGPFVMNTHDELVEAFGDYQQGKMGTL